MRVDMSGYRRVNYYELCRLCTSSEGNKTHIFKEDGRKRQLSAKIQLCLRLQVSEEDSLPKIVCNMCLEKLEGFCDFKNSCLKAESMLESYASALRFNSDFKKEGKVYIKDVPYGKDSFDDETIHRLEVTSTPISTQEIHVQLQAASPVKVSPAKSQTLTSIPVPVSIDSLSSLVQAAAIQIVQSHPDSDDGRLQYKMQMQPAVEAQPTEHDYSYQTSVSESPIIKQSTPHQTLSKNMKSTSTQMDEHLNSSVQEVEVDGDPLQSTITFTTNNSGQDVLLHFGLAKDKDESMYQQPEETDNRASMVHIREFLKMKADDEITDEEEDKCEHCGKHFSTEEERINHASACTGDEKISTSYICDNCGKLFKRKEHLFQHKKLHTGERPFACGHCGKTFSRKEHLVRHSVSHTGQKQYSCDLCGKSFGRKDNVRKHRKTHSLSGPFVCETCGKQFVVKPYYLMHKASHGDDPPHRCDVCQRTFSTKQYLTTHKLKHKEPASPPTTTLSLPQRSFQVVTTTTSPTTTLVCSSTSPPRVVETFKRINPT